MNIKQKRKLYEAVMRSVRKSLNESENYTYEDICNTLEDEFPLSITTYAGTQEDTYNVTVSEYDEDDTCLYFHAETEVGFYVDFEIPVDEFFEQYASWTAEEIVEWYLVDAVDDEVASQYSRGEYDHDNMNLDESEYNPEYDDNAGWFIDESEYNPEYDDNAGWFIDEDVNSVEQYYYIITLQDGTEVYNSLDDDLSFDSYKEAEYECDSKLDDIVDSQSDDEDAFMIGDYRTKIISM